MHFYSCGDWEFTKKLQQLEDVVKLTPVAFCLPLPMVYVEFDCGIDQVDSKVIDTDNSCDLKPEM